jgi:hypothetical protein
MFKNLHHVRIGHVCHMYSGVLQLQQMWVLLLIGASTYINPHHNPWLQALPLTNSAPLYCLPFRLVYGTQQHVPRCACCCSSSSGLQAVPLTDVVLIFACHADWCMVHSSMCLAVPAAAAQRTAHTAAADANS